MEVGRAMAEKKRHVVRVFSQELRLLSEESDEYIGELASFVDSIMNKLYAGRKMSFGELGIVTSISIADKLFKLKKGARTSNGEMHNLEDELANAISKSMRMEAEKHEKIKECESLKSEIKSLKTKLESRLSSDEELREKLNVLSYELRKPLKERRYESELKVASSLLSGKSSGDEDSTEFSSKERKQLGIDKLL